MHPNSLRLMQHFVDKYLCEKRGQALNIADIGSQDVNGTYRPLFDDPSWRYTGMDIGAGENVDFVLANAYHWKGIPSRHYDLVVSGQAFEHIEFIWKTMWEVERVLKPGGMFVMIAPASFPQHRYPLDCWRIYDDGAAALAKAVRMDVVEVSATAHSAAEVGAAPDAGYGHLIDTMLVAQKPVNPTLKRRLANAIEGFVSRFFS